MSNVQFRLVGVFAIEELSALADRFIAPPRQDEQLKRLGVVESWGQGAMVTAACVGDGLTLASRSVRSMIQSFLDVYKARSTQSTVEYFDIEKSVLQVLGNDPEFWKALRTPAPSPVDGVDSILLPANWRFCIYI